MKQVGSGQGLTPEANEGLWLSSSDLQIQVVHVLRLPSSLLLSLTLVIDLFEAVWKNMHMAGDGRFPTQLPTSHSIKLRLS